MPRLFADEAPHYWDAGYSPLPLTGKTPVVKRWNSYCDNLPNLITRAEWLVLFPDANLGLALGKELVPGFRLGAVDVDDERFVPLVETLVGLDGPIKLGKKGRTFIVLIEKHKGAATTSIKTSSSNHAIDLLVGDRQTVLPPSIHPETGKHYVWASKPLLSYALEKIPRLTAASVLLLRCVVEAAESEAMLVGRGTHDPGLKLAAKMVSISGDDALIRRLLESLLPKGYAGNSGNEIGEWIASARSKGFDKARGKPIDAAVAEAVAIELAPLKYTARDGFIRYAAGYWRAVSDNDIKRALKVHLEARLGAKGMVGTYLDRALNCLLLDVEDTAFDAPQALICLTNGTVRLTDGELLPHSPDHHLRYGLDIAWDTNARAPTYEEQLRSTLRGDQKAIEAFEEFAGLTLVDDQRFQRALFLMGEGGSGKSTLLRTVQIMHDPSAVSATPLDKLEDDRYRTDVAGKLVNISFDVQTNQRIFGETFVRITGGDYIAVRRLFQEVQGLVRPSVRFMGSMNPDMPPYQGAPDALRRRLIILVCGEKVTNPDTHREEHLRAERAGILARWVSALGRLYSRGAFDPPATSTAEVDEYLLAYEPFGQFIEDRLMPDNRDFISVAEITAEYNEWAETS